MSVLIVGGDYIEPLRREIAARGVDTIRHWSGRKPGDLKREVPADTRLIVVLCDYVSHQLAFMLKKQAGRARVPMLYSRRSASDLRSKLESLLLESQ
ncbi:MAG TPA: DUF2325 domain-containing protein [Burkholderiales bacterium]|nr:DUF2325 domain-containing protein [Burkholderiales bacterium]